MTVSWNENHLPTILTKQKLKDIYNTDEFSLFYQAPPDTSFHYKEERFSGGKYSKVRLTKLDAGNATGEKLPIFIIGKSVKPRCFSGVKGLPCCYRVQNHSWMDGDLFIKLVREVNKKGASQDRKITLIIDNWL